MRNYPLDILRFLSICAVVMIHVASMVEPLHDSFFAQIAADMSRWCVPAFIMISGAFLLNKNISLKNLWSVRIARLIFLLLTFNYFYWIISPRSLPSIIQTTLIYGEVHLWFLYALIGIYALIPILKSVVDSGWGGYFVAIWFVINILLYSINFANGWMLDNFSSNLLILNLGYSGYFVLGYLLMNNVLSKKIERLLYVVGGASFALMLLLPRTKFCHFIRPAPYFSLGYFHVFIFFLSVAFFYFFKSRQWMFNSKWKNVIKDLSSSSLGIYLIHPVILLFFNEFLIQNDGIASSFFVTCLIWGLTMCISFFIVKLLRAHPIFCSWVE